MSSLKDRAAQSVRGDAGLNRCRALFRRGVAARAAVFFLSLLGSCAFSPGLAQARDLDAIRASGHLNIGVEPGLPPLAGYDDHNRLVGYDLDVGSYLARKLGVEPRFVTVTSSGRILYLLAGKVDVVLGGLTRTADREAVIAFSAPLYRESFAAIMPGFSPVQHFADLATGRFRLVEVRGSTAVSFMRAQAPRAAMLVLDTYEDAMRALAQGRGDALVDVIDYVGHLVPQDPRSPWRIEREFAPPAGEDGIGMNPRDRQLIAEVNRIIEAMRRSRALRSIDKRWFGADTHSE